ncbi:unnamed protein product [Echinostoma caproni]|uniref:Periplasmic nitrate reductase, electron transfer subunit n=1 Tax=Echinostoma caproni TaxID=27848 RepID=A0A183AHP5_9TREM|nr:unnamed protein product [Echinostoma caproni]
MLTTIPNSANTISRLRVELERVIRERDRLAQLVRVANENGQYKTNPPDRQDNTAHSSPAIRPCMGLGQRMAQSKLGGSMDSSAFVKGIPDELTGRTGSLGSCPTQSRTSNWKSECDSITAASKPMRHDYCAACHPAFPNLPPLLKKNQTPIEIRSVPSAEIIGCQAAKPYL